VREDMRSSECQSLARHSPLSYCFCHSDAERGGGIYDEQSLPPRAAGRRSIGVSCMHNGVFCRSQRPASI